MAKQKKRADQLYEKKVTIGRNANGTLKRKSIYATTKAELDLKVAEALQNLNKGILIDDKNMTVEQWSNRWYDTYIEDSKLADGTKYMYKNAINSHIIPEIGPLKIKELKQHHVINLVNKKEAEGLTRGVEIFMLTLKRILDAAVDNDYIIKNPASNVKPTGYNKEPKDPLTDEQINIVKETDHRARSFILFLMYTGMRLGEAIAITWNDIDLKNKTISINKSAELLTNQPKIKDTKTYSSNRTIPIVDPLYEILKNLDSQSVKITNIKDVKNKKNKPEYVFKNVSGDKLTKVGINRLIESYRLAVGFHFTYHQLRHTCATLLYNAGVGLKEAQAWLGHSTISVTMDIYTHLDEKNQNKAVGQMNEMLKSI